MRIFQFILLSIFLFSCKQEKTILSAENPDYSVSSSLEPSLCYSIQFARFSEDSLDKVLEIYNDLKSNEIVYYYKSPSNENYRIWDIKLNIGKYDTYQEAEEYAKLKFSNFSEIIIDSLYLYSDKKNEEFELLTTPSTLWQIGPSYKRDIYRFDTNSVNRYDMCFSTMAVLSPQKTEAVFLFQNQIIKVDLVTLEEFILVGKQNSDLSELYDSEPKWSYNGDYVAFVNFADWEANTSLYVIDSEGEKLELLVSNIYSTNSAVRSFMWHPSQLGIFFIELDIYGNVGGSLSSISIDGDRKNIVQADPEKKEGLSHNFELLNNMLRYEIVQYDSSYFPVERKKLSITIPDI